MVTIESSKFMMAWKRDFIFDFLIHLTDDGNLAYHSLLPMEVHSTAYSTMRLVTKQAFLPHTVSFCDLTCSQWIALIIMQLLTINYVNDLHKYLANPSQLTRNLIHMLLEKSKNGFSNPSTVQDPNSIRQKTSILFLYEIVSVGFLSLHTCLLLHCFDDTCEWDDVQWMSLANSKVVCGRWHTEVSTAWCNVLKSYFPGKLSNLCK